MSKLWRRPSDLIRAGIFLVFIVALPFTAQSAPLKKASSGGRQAVRQTTVLRIGSAWYPEQWPEKRWDKDLQLMQDAGFNVVRIGEFAWSRMEPSEGSYDFAWLETAVRLAEKHHIAVVLGTPTDAPPAWLTTKYPETLRVDASGRRAEHGGRRQFSYSSPRYREFCREIATEMAKRFGHNPNVIGWQIGNEYTDESFDSQTRTQFQEWLRRKYGSLDSLNQHWTTAYWSQTYDAWSEIPLNAKPGNPGWMLDHRHFVTATWESFQKVQVDAIRAHSDPRQFITTNLGGLGWSDNFDHYIINRDLSFAAWDDYVGQGHLNAVRNAAMHDFVRGWKRRNFWVMETQPAFVNWAPVNNSLYPGETRAMAWQAVGHGADAILYWQWRSALNGQEQYHGSVVGPDGEPLPLYPELKKLAGEFENLSPAFAGATPRSEVAIVLSYDSRWAIDFQPHSQQYDQLQVLLDFYGPLDAAAQSVDIVDSDGPLNGYRLVVAPSLNVISAGLARHLLQYVKQGGHLLLGPRSGMKDEYDSLNPQRQPGPLADALGGRVEQYYALDQPVSTHGVFGDRAASIWAEVLAPEASDTRVLVRYGKEDGWLSDRPAMITRKLGKGTISYLGTILDSGGMQAVLSAALQEVSVKPIVAPLPEDIEVCRRIAATKEIFVLINHGPQARTIKAPDGLKELLGPQQDADRRILLSSQDVAVFEKRLSSHRSVSGSKPL